MIDIAPQDLAVVQKILRAHLSDAKIWVFGSRAKGTARRGSDLDLAIAAPRHIPSALAEALDEAPLPFNVDLVELDAISPEFRALIDTHKIALPGFE